MGEDLREARAGRGGRGDSGLSRPCEGCYHHRSGMRLDRPTADGLSKNILRIPQKSRDSSRLSDLSPSLCLSKLNNPQTASLLAFDFIEQGAALHTVHAQV